MLQKSLFCLSLLLILSCQSKKSPSPLPQQETVAEVGVGNDKFVFGLDAYLAKPEDADTFQTDFTIVKTFEFKDQYTTKTAILALRLQNSNPAEGFYHLEKFVGYRGEDIYPGRGKAQMSLTVNNNVFDYRDSSSFGVYIKHKGDSIEVSFLSIPMYSFNTKILFSGKFMIATKPVKPLLKGHATYTDGNADTLWYWNQNGFHFYQFANKPPKPSYTIFQLKFSEPLQETKTYKVTHRIPTQGEVSFVIALSDRVVYDAGGIDNIDGKVFVTKKANGDISIDFEDIACIGLIGRKAYGHAVISTFMP